MNMSARKFFVSWIVSSLLMFGLSYLWHGVLLNDFNRLSYPKGIFFIVASIVYLIIGFAVVKVYTLKIFEKVSGKMTIRGLVAGALCGVVFYMIAMVVGISFSTELKIQYIALDMAWQAMEQGVGGMAVAVVGIWIHDYLPEDF